MTLRSFSLGSEYLSSRWVTARPAYEAPSTTTVLAMVVTVELSMDAEGW